MKKICSVRSKAWINISLDVIWFGLNGTLKPIDINRLRRITALEFGTPVTQG